MNPMGQITSFINPAIEFVQGKVKLQSLYEILRPILQRLIDTAFYEKELMHAISGDEHLRIRKCFYYGSDLNTTKYHLFKETPLMFALECGSYNALKVLIALGADVNKRSESRDKVTALFLACRGSSGQSPDLQIIEQLLQAGANPNRAVKGGITPLMEASFQVNLLVVELLLKYGAEPNFIDARNHSALSLCCLKKFAPNNQIDQEQVIRKLNEVGALLPEKIELDPSLRLHPKIKPQHLFKSGLLLPDQAIEGLKALPFSMKNKKIKKYTTEIPSLFRSVLIGKSRYILYDSHQFFSTCEGCLRGVSPNNYLGQGGEAKIKIVQDCETAKFYAARIAKRIGKYELEILELFHCLVDHIETESKHYIIQKLLNGVRLYDYQIRTSKEKPEIVVIKIMTNIIRQIKLLNDHGYLHRDIAADNIILNPETFEVQCIDFGYSIKKPGVMNGFAFDQIKKGSIPLAPELENPQNFVYPYSEQSEIFALGILFSDLLLQLPKEIPALLLIQSEMTSHNPVDRKDLEYYLERFTKS